MTRFIKRINVRASNALRTWFKHFISFRIDYRHTDRPTYIGATAVPGPPKWSVKYPLNTVPYVDLFCALSGCNMTIQCVRANGLRIKINTVGDGESPWRRRASDRPPAAADVSL